MPRGSSRPVSDASCPQGSKILDRFRDVFSKLDERRTPSSPERDPRRGFDAAGYFSMVLFTLLNPVVDTMRGPCEASKLDEYQRRTGLPRGSLGSFSEAQGVFNPELRELMEDITGDPPASLVRAMRGNKIEAIDSRTLLAGCQLLLLRKLFPRGLPDSPAAEEFSQLKMRICINSRDLNSYQQKRIERYFEDHFTFEGKGPELVWVEDDTDNILLGFPQGKPGDMVVYPSVHDVHEAPVVMFRVHENELLSIAGLRPVFSEMPVARSS